jgi:hypothetical protein
VNKTQKLILAIFVPIIFFFIVLIIANSVGVSSYSYVHTESYGEGKYGKYMEGAPVRDITSTRYRPNPFEWEETWYVWLLYSASCCLFEFLLFRDKKTIVKNKK